MLVLASLARAQVGPEQVPLPPSLVGHVGNRTDEKLWCDDRGNLLLPFYDSSVQPGYKLVTVSPTGALLGTFDISSMPGLPKAFINDHAMSPQGDVFIIASRITEQSVTKDENGHVTGTSYELDMGNLILRFSLFGELVSTARLEIPLRAKAMAVFGSGDLLIIGWQYKRRNQDRVPFAGIFSSSGQLKRQVILPGVLSREEKDRQWPGTAMQGLRVRVGEDGNAYVLAEKYTPKLYVLTPNGDLISKTTLRFPSNVQELWKEQFSDGEMAAELVFKDQRNAAPHDEFVVFDANSGKIDGRFETPDAGVHLACFHDGFLTFVTSTGEALEFLQLSPQTSHR